MKWKISRDGIEDAHDPDDDNDGYSDIAEIAYGSDRGIQTQ